MFSWKIINEDYLNYLRHYENRIPNTYYGDNKLKPFFGDLFVIDDLVYVTQVSSPKPRHNKLKDALDFIKLFEGQKLLAVINLNYMFPVPKKELMNLEYKNIDKYVNFADKIQENNYIHLLKKEMLIIQGKPLTQNAIKIYN